MSVRWTRFYAVRAKYPDLCKAEQNNDALYAAKALGWGFWIEYVLTASASER